MERVILQRKKSKNKKSITGAKVRGRISFQKPKSAGWTKGRGKRGRLI